LLRRCRRSSVEKIEIGSDIESLYFTNIGRSLEVHVLVEERSLRIGDRKIEHDRIRVLAAADAGAAVAAAASDGRQEAEQPEARPIYNERDDSTASIMMTHWKSLSPRVNISEGRPSNPIASPRIRVSLRHVATAPHAALERIKYDAAENRYDVIWPVA